jgi:NitT/TauT family transport system substrate-binding protein
VRKHRDAKGLAAGLFSLALAITACAGCGATSAGEGSSHTWRHGVVLLQGDSGFVQMAKEKGFFKDRGLNVQFVEFKSDQTMIQALIAGELDSGESSPAGMVRSVQAGSDLVIIGSTVEGLAWSLFAKPGTDSLDDLKGKTVGTSTSGSLPDVYAKAAFKEEGVDPRSIEFANVGAGPEAYGALSAGRIDAVPLSDEYLPQAKKDGMSVLKTPAVTSQYPRRMIMGRASTFEKDREGTVAFLTAEIEGQQYSLKHRDEVIKLSAKLSGRDADDPSLSAIYDVLVDNDMVSADLGIPTSKVEWLMKTLVDLKAMPKVTPVEDIIDDSYLKDAQKKASQ